MLKTTKLIARAGVVGGLYAVLSLAVFPLASGQIQVRIGEALSILPLIFPESIIGLTVGCLIVNLLTTTVVADIVFGTLITLVAGVCCFFMGRLFKKDILKVMFGGIFAVVLNAFLLPVIWYFASGGLEYVYMIQVLFLLAGQVISVYALGVPLYFGLVKLKEKGIRFLN